VTLSLAAFMLTIVIGAVLWQWVRTSSVIELAHQVSSLKSVFSVLRLTVIALLAAFWPALTHGFARWRQLDNTARAQLLAARWRIVGWLVLLELILGQNLLARFVHAIQSMIA